MKPESLVAIFLGFANRLRFRNLFFLILFLFITDLLVPDMIPMIDEIILGLLAVLLANWKNAKTGEVGGNFMEGKIIDDDDKQYKD